MKGVAKRSAFVIDQDGIIRYTEVLGIFRICRILKRLG